MVSSKDQSSAGLIYNIRLSSVGPGRVTGQDVVYEPKGIDLAMKLHYIRLVYYFNGQAFEGISVKNIKEPMFNWLNQYYMVCGRFRRSSTESTGRPYIKCNDCGVRFVEAQCQKSLDEWLQFINGGDGNDDNDSVEKLLVSDSIIGPELDFSPLAFFQFTKFKCGGMAIGLSIAHVLGDIFSVAEFMNMFGKVMNGYNPRKQLNLSRSLTKTHIPDTDDTKGSSQDPLSVKRVDPVGDKWITVNNSKMGTFSFKVNAEQLSQIQTSKMGKTEFDTFEVLCALIWQSIAKIRNKTSEPKMVTICKKWNDEVDRILSNSQMITVAKSELVSVVDANPSELAGLIKNSIMEDNNDEIKMVEEAMDKENGVADFVIYGGNLTFVNLEEAKFYGFECKGQLPVRVSCFIDGVGDEGAVLVLPAAAGGGKNDGFSRIVTLILPENEAKELKSELKSIIY